MEYILSQKEYDALTPVKRLQERNDALEVARLIIVSLSGDKWCQGYCDRCPISHIGDRFDKNPGGRPSHTISKLICGKQRSYSK